MLNNLKTFDQYGKINEKKGIVPGMEFYIDLIKKELFVVKKKLIALRAEYAVKKFKGPKGREKALIKAIEEQIVNVPIIIEPPVDTIPPEYPIKKLIIVFNEVREGARATYKNEQTVFEDGVIKEAKIGLKLYIDLSNQKNPIEVLEMSHSRVPHELTHLYQHYKWKDKNDYGKNRQILKKEFGKLAKKDREIIDNKETPKVEKTKRENSEYLTTFLRKAIYYFSEKEIAAKVTQTYYELIKEKTTKKEFSKGLSKTTHWRSLMGTYVFNLDILYDLVKHGHTVVFIEKDTKIKMNFTDEDLTNILNDLNDVISEKDKSEILNKYNISYYYDKPREFFIKLFRHFDIKIDKFKKKLLGLVMQMPDKYPAVKKKVVVNGAKPVETTDKASSEEEAPEEIEEVAMQGDGDETNSEIESIPAQTIEAEEE